ncbi:MAG TPA: glutathione peroxidase [Ilumatobacteraceae bacterium]
MSDISEIEFNTMDGGVSSLGQYAGDVLLVVNVASQCGLTPQYAGLQELHAELSGDGFSVLGFPANDFGGQEPGTDEEIAEFCDTNYHVTFPVFSKISVVGDDQHPLYGALTSSVPTAEGKGVMRDRLRGFGMTPTEDPDVLWNFEKFVIGRDGNVAARFAPAVTPDDPELRAVIDRELAKG